jgi:uncharacterized small protein (DUF1192 family)
MALDRRRKLDNNRMKLRELDELYTKIHSGRATSEHMRQLNLRSLRKRINQFKEEIARFKAHVDRAP